MDNLAIARYFSQNAMPTWRTCIESQVFPESQMKLLLLLSLTSFTQKILAQHLDSQGQRLFEGDNVMLKIDSSIYEKATISDLGTSERRSENPKGKVTYSYLGGLLATQRVTYKIDSRYSVTAHYGWFPLCWQEVSIDKRCKFPTFTEPSKVTMNTVSVKR